MKDRSEFCPAGRDKFQKRSDTALNEETSVATILNLCPDFPIPRENHWTAWWEFNLLMEFMFQNFCLGRAKVGTKQNHTALPLVVLLNIAFCLNSAIVRDNLSYLYEN